MELKVYSYSRRPTRSPRIHSMELKVHFLWYANYCPVSTPESIQWNWKLSKVKEANELIYVRIHSMELKDIDSVVRSSEEAYRLLNPFNGIEKF